jgi:hypothetical protein
MAEGRRTSPIKQPLRAAWYAGLSILALAVALLVGWYLLNKPDLVMASGGPARGYYVLLVVLGFAAAAFLFGAMRSAARIIGGQIGSAYEFGGPAAIAIAVVAGGLLVKEPEDFSLTIRLHAADPITDLQDTSARVDMGAHRDERQFSRNGEVIFSDVPVRFLSAELQVELLSKTLELKTPKLTYRIPSGRVLYLDVIRKPTGVAVDLGYRTLIAHYIGDPIVGFNFGVSNETDTPADLTDLALDIRSPKGETFSLIVAAVSSTQRTNDFNAPPGTWRIYKGVPFNVYLWWAPIPWQMLGYATLTEIMRLPEYSALAFKDRFPCQTESRLPADADEILQRQFAKAFIWTAGSWSFNVSGALSGKRFSVPRIVDLTSSEVEAMKGVTQLYKHCIGVYVQNMFVADPPPYVEKANRAETSIITSPAN